MKGKWAIILRTQGKELNTELKNALNSVIAQRYDNLYILLTIHSDNDKIIQKTLSFIEPFQKIVEIQPLIIKEKQGNRAYPLNQALKNLKSEYVSFLDNDDIYYPNMGEDLIKLLERHNATFSYGVTIKAQQQYQTDKYGNKYLYIIKKSCFKKEPFNILSFFLDNSIPFNSFILKTSLIGDTRFDERLYYLEDWDFLKKLFLKETFSIAQSYKPVSEYRLRYDHTDTFNTRNHKKWLKSRRITDNNISKDIISLKIEDIFKLKKIPQEEYLALQTELNTIKQNPAYKIWIKVRDNRFINGTLVRWIRNIRGKYN